jgi:uncharacterized repeat protein (TIGR01451 family)
MIHTLLAGVMTLIFSGSVFAATNTATGDIGGTDADLADSSAFEIIKRDLALFKTAFLTSGSELATSSRLRAGETVRFMVYVNNDTSVAVNDVSIQDVLDATFSYGGTAIRIGSVAACTSDTTNGTCDGTEKAALYSAIMATSAINDAVEAGDVVGVTGSTVDIGNQNVANAQLNVPGNTMWGVIIEVTIQ